MKKSLKIFLNLSIVLLFIFISSTLSLMLILEPNIKINGFAELDKNRLDSIGTSMQFTDNQGQSVSDDININGGNYSEYNELPQTLINAFIAIEDNRFFSHKGIDYKRIIGALIHNIKAGRIVEGASTITQQLVKNTHLNSDKTLKRKIQEIRISKQIERNYSKKEIMEMYLNMLYFGNDIYGIGNAAVCYFQTNVKNLSLNQCAALAAVINNPAAYNPYKNIDNLTVRKNQVLKRMKDLSFINEDEYSEAVNTELKINTQKQVNNHFFDFAFAEANKIIGINKSDLLKQKYRIKTTLNQYYQNAIETELQNIIPDDNILSQCVLIENKTGKVLAYAGSERINYNEFPRQLGSTLKPIIAYSPCLEKNLIVPSTPILDEPTTFDNEFAPKNYHNKYQGWISAQEALSQSSNVCAVKFVEMADLNYCFNFAKKAGLTFEPDDKNLILALGASHNGNKLIEIANAYQMLGNAGSFIPCTFIEEINTPKGNILHDSKPSATRVMDSGNAYLVNSMLCNCVKNGTAKRLKNCKYAVAAKTGTVGTKDGNTDAYCITYGENYTLAVWFGPKEGKMPNEISGGTLPTIAAKNILENLKLNMNEFSRPDTIVKLDIDRIEYEKNHKVLLNNGLIPQRELIHCLFHKNNIPKERSQRYFPEYVLKLNKSKYFNLFSEMSIKTIA